MAQRDTPERASLISAAVQRTSGRRYANRVEWGLNRGSDDLHWAPRRLKEFDRKDAEWLLSSEIELRRVVEFAVDAAAADRQDVDVFPDEHGTCPAPRYILEAELVSVLVAELHTLRPLR